MDANQTYRVALIEQLTSHSVLTIAANLGGWATDRLNAIRSIEWDMAEAGVEFTPFNLSHWMIKQAK